MAHRIQIPGYYSGKEWWDPALGEDFPDPGHDLQLKEPIQEEQIAPGGVFDFVDDWISDWGAIVDPVFDIAADLFQPDPEEGVVEIDAPEELEEFEVIAADQPEPDFGDQSQQGNWLDPWFDLLTETPWNVVTTLFENVDVFARDITPIELPEVEPMPPVAEMPTPVTGGGNGAMPGFCAPGAARPSASRARTALLRQAAWRLGQCRMKYSSFKWFVKHAGIQQTQAILGLTPQQIAFLLMNAPRRRGGGITPAQIRNVNKTMRKLDSLTRKLNCACGSKRTYKRKKKVC